MRRPRRFKSIKDRIILKTIIKLLLYGVLAALFPGAAGVLSMIESFF